MGFTETAAELGVTVVDGHVEEGWGSWDHETRTITLRAGMGAVQRRSVVARLLGHASLEHEEWTEAGAREAAEWSAKRLIPAERFAATLEAIDWAELLARALKVMPSDVAAYYQSLTDDERLRLREMITFTSGDG